MDFNFLYPFVSGKPESVNPGSFTNQHIVFPGADIKELDAVILGLPDNDSEKGFQTAEQVRNQLYKLSGLSKKLKILDLGNIVPGNTFDETCERLKVIVSLVISSDAKLLLIGNSNIYNKVIANTFIDNQVPINQVWIDSLINWGHFVIDPLSANFAESLRNSDFNFINIGYQSYFVEKEILDFINDSHFEAYRLGVVRSKTPDFEPVLRDANLVNISLNAVKLSDAPGSRHSSPNGLSGEEICQLGFFAGYSNRFKALALFDIVPAQDLRGATSMLAAQIIWYTFEGMAVKVFEDPGLTPDVFTKYHIHIDIANQNLAFYRSNLTQRWWMEIEMPQKNQSVIISSSEKDYELACMQEIPDRWWRFFNRI